MLNFTNIRVAYSPPPGMSGFDVGATAPVRHAEQAAKAAATYAQAAGSSAPPNRAADTVSVNSLLLELDHDQLGAFTALSPETQDKIKTLHSEGKVDARTVKQAMNLPLTDVRSQRWTKELMPARLTDADRRELAAIEERRNRPGFRDAEETMRDLQREQEIRLGVKVPEGKTGIPVPLGHPGVHIARGSDIIANQKLKDLGVDIARDPGFETRLMDKLRSGDISQTDRSVHLDPPPAAAPPPQEEAPPPPAPARADAKDGPAKPSTFDETDFQALVSAFVAKVRSGFGRA